MMDLDKRCSVTVYGGGRWNFRGHRCTRKAVKDGYCAQHSPEAAQARDDKRRDQIAAARQRERQRWAEALRLEGWTVIPPKEAR